MYVLCQDSQLLVGAVCAAFWDPGNPEFLTERYHPYYGSYRFVFSSLPKKGSSLYLNVVSFVSLFRHTKLFHWKFDRTIRSRNVSSFGSSSFF